MSKSILCYGDSNTWGYIAGSFSPQYMLAKRYDYHLRWTGILQERLSHEYQIIESGLNGRNTSFDEQHVIRPSRNGLAALPLILEMHYPLDWVIFMLGTNDLRTEFNASCERITQGMQQLIHTVKSCRLGPNFTSPRIMLIAPAQIYPVDTATFNNYFSESSCQKSAQLASRYAALAQEEGCAFVDASLLKVSMVDGVHLEQASHNTLANMLFNKLTELKL